MFERMIFRSKKNSVFENCVLSISRVTPDKFWSSYDLLGYSF